MLKYKMVVTNSIGQKNVRVVVNDNNVKIEKIRVGKTIRKTLYSNTEIKRTGIS